MAAPKGNNFGKGRPKGSVNKSTSETRAIIMKVVHGELENIDTLMGELSAKERLDVTMKLLCYVLPKAANPLAIQETEPSMN